MHALLSGVFLRFIRHERNAYNRERQGSPRQLIPSAFEFRSHASSMAAQSDSVLPTWRLVVSRPPKMNPHPPSEVMNLRGTQKQYT